MHKYSMIIKYTNLNYIIIQPYILEECAQYDNTRP